MYHVACSGLRQASFQSSVLFLVASLVALLGIAPLDTASTEKLKYKFVCQMMLI